MQYDFHDTGINSNCGKTQSTLKCSRLFLSVKETVSSAFSSILSNCNSLSMNGNSAKLTRWILPEERKL